MTNFNLPIIDLADSSKSNCATLLEAASQHGFLLLKNHLLEETEIDKLFEISKQFFDQPTEIKNELPITTNNAGYVAPFVEDLQEDGTGEGDDKEAFNITHFNLSNFYPNQPLPLIFQKNMPFISFTLRKYYVMLHMICRMLAIALDIRDNNGNPDHEYFVSAHALDLKTHSTLRFVHYNAIDSIDSMDSIDSNETDKVLAGAHTDYGSMTFILQRPSLGLEVFDGEKWIEIKIPESDNLNEYLIVNISDVLSFWTDGYLKSILHRVRTKNERYSVVFFCHPSDESILSPVNSKIVKNYNGNCYSLDKNGNPLTALEHLTMRLDDGYKRI